MLPDLYLGQAYTDGSLVIENGSFNRIFRNCYEECWKRRYKHLRNNNKKVFGTYRYLTNFNLIKKSKSNVAHHYDISEKLYDLFLDENRQYSCAYFKNDNDTLEDAQQNKMNHIIKKLNLKNNQKVLDIGSGWGTFSNRNS